METTSLHTAFRSINDPRIERKKKHSLLDIIILSVTGVLCGADGSEDIAEFGKIHLTFLRQFLELKNGIPSHDTIRRVFMLLNPKAFEKCFSQWAQSMKDEGVLERVIAIDGKTSRRTESVCHP